MEDFSPNHYLSIPQEYLNYFETKILEMCSKGETSTEINVSFFKGKIELKGKCKMFYQEPFYNLYKKLIPQLDIIKQVFLVKGSLEERNVNLDFCIHRKIERNTDSKFGRW